LFEIRRVVEPGAAELASEIAEPTDLAALDHAFAAMEQADPTSDAAIAADVAFHRAILPACHSDLLLQFRTLIAIGLETSSRISTRCPSPTIDPCCTPSISATPQRRAPPCRRSYARRLPTSSGRFGSRLTLRPPSRTSLVLRKMRCRDHTLGRPSRWVSQLLATMKSSRTRPCGTPWRYGHATTWKRRPPTIGRRGTEPASSLRGSIHNGNVFWSGSGSWTEFLQTTGSR
jgi:hypothetical protein